MKQYLEIPGYHKAPRVPCFAFEKYDGSNLRFSFKKKTGWGIAGTRHRLFDETDPVFGPAIKLFAETLAPSIEKAFKDKYFKSLTEAIIFCEFYGPNSFAGQHVDSDPKKLTLIDIQVHKKGYLIPKDFVDIFGHLDNCAKLLYTGELNDEFIQDVVENKYNLTEGVVCKGTLPNKNPQHSLWMCKIKTKEWLKKLGQRAEENEWDEGLIQTYIDNFKEQIVIEEVPL